MPIIKLDVRIFDDLIVSWFKECTPKILVVTDNLNFSAGDSFGLTEFVASLRASAIHGMTPTVITAHYNPSAAAVLSYDAPNQHITNYKFTDATHGLLKSRYDVVFMLSINRESGPRLTDETGALNAVTAFMQAGGGVFATGDHEDLGAGMCMDVPRVRKMRYWKAADTPSAGGTNRLTTNLPGRGDIVGSDDIYEFSDQSDQFPQRLFVNYRTQAGGSTATPMLNYAHPVLQTPGSTRAIEVFPDHPHEGECVIPTDLMTKLADNVTFEWPEETGTGTRVAPEMAALTVSHGNGFPGKNPVTPRSFIAICAYDGQRANVGRVVTDATWHHFVNINIKPGMSALAGRDLSDIKQYYVNLATWLMPKNVRLCRRYPLILRELVRFPLFEELPPIPRVSLDGLQLRDIGELVATSLQQRHTKADVTSLVDDALEDAIGPDAKRKFADLGRGFGSISARDAGLAALGSITMATAEQFNKLKDEPKLDGEKAFGEIGRPAAAAGVKLYLSQARSKLSKLDALIGSITG